jgi:hypothetical protein
LFRPPPPPPDELQRTGQFEVMINNGHFNVDLDCGVRVRTGQWSNYRELFISVAAKFATGKAIGLCGPLSCSPDADRAMINSRGCASPCFVRGGGGGVPTIS